MTEELNETQLVQKVKDYLKLNEVESLLNSNKKEFDFNGNTYRVRAPSYKEKRDAAEKKLSYYTELLQGGQYKLESVLKKTYKEKQGIDIKAMDDAIFNKMKRRDDLMLQLGQLLAKDINEGECVKFRDEIFILISDINEIIAEKVQLLECSLENQVMTYTYSYLSYLLGEKKEGEQWVKIWKTFEELEGDNTQLPNIIMGYLMNVVTYDNMA